VKKRAPLDLQTLEKVFPAIVLDGRPGTIPRALMNAYGALKATGRTAYVRCSSYSNKAPLITDDDVAAECWVLAPRALVACITLAADVPASVAQRLNTYAMQASVHGQYLEDLFQKGHTAEQVWHKLVAHATQHFSALHIGNYLRELDLYCITPGKHGMDVVLMDLKERAMVALALCPDANTLLRIIRAIGQFLAWQLPNMLLALRLHEPDMVEFPERWRLEDVWKALESLRTTEHVFAELPASVAHVTVVFDPAAPSEGAAAATREPRQQQEARGKEQEKPGKRNSKVMNVEVAYTDTAGLNLMAMFMAAMADMKHTQADQQGGGCYNCGSHSHQFFKCEENYSAAAWAAAEQKRPAMMRWRPHDNGTLQKLKARICSERERRETGKPGGRGAGRGAGRGHRTSN
jgi:hypothetical protein